MAAAENALAAVHERLGGRARYTTPLLCVPQTSVPTVWMYYAAGLLYIKVYDGKLRFAEVVPAPDEADLLYMLERLFIRQTAAQLGIGNLYAVKANVFLYLKSCPKQFDVIFSDAPYDLESSEQVVRLVLENDLLRPEGVLIFEHSKKMDFSAYPEFWQQRSYGSVQFSFFRRQ